MYCHVSEYNYGAAATGAPAGLVFEYRAMPVNSLLLYSNELQRLPNASCGQFYSVK